MRDSRLPVTAITQALRAVEAGEAGASDRLLRLVYDELRRIASSRMALEHRGTTLQPTALVHEAWLRLVGTENPKFKGRAHFFGAAAEAMRRILIDRARRKRALRHGGGQLRVAIDDVEISTVAEDDQLLAVNDALEKLSAQDKAKAELVKLRYFVGMTIEEAAQMLCISEPTAKRWWTYARAWLYNEITKTNG